MKSTNLLVILSGLCLVASGAQAASTKKNSAMAASSQSSSLKASGKDWLVSLPVVAERPQMRLHVEYNADHSIGLGFEAAAISTTEELGEEEILTTGNSLTLNGVQGSLLMSRYSDEAHMGGFFWTVGAGYRKWHAEWKKKPDERENQRLGLVDDGGYLHHRVEGKGVTAHLRAGYRYVANEWPLSLGAHIGLRHMNSQVTDVAVNDSEQEKLQLNYSELNDKERRELRHRMMTTPDFTVDLGLAF